MIFKVISKIRKIIKLNVSQNLTYTYDIIPSNLIDHIFMQINIQEIIFLFTFKMINCEFKG